MRMSSKYGYGDRVWGYTIQTERVYEVCKGCGGTGLILLNGEEFGCPKCGQWKSCANSGRVPVGWRNVPSVRAYTIGQVRVEMTEKPRDGKKEKEVTYMCYETGVGSGSVYSEEGLFKREGDARDAGNRAIVRMEQKQREESEATYENVN